MTKTTVITTSMITSGPVAPLSTRGRLIRAGVFGGASLLLATTAHLVGGGSLPPAGLLVVAAVVLGLIGTALTGRRVRGPLLLAVLAAEQWGLHQLFDLGSALGSAGSAGSLSCAGSMSGMGHGSCASAAQAIPGEPTMAAGMLGGTGLVMLAGHLLATLLTAWLLTRGETAVWRWADRIGAVLTGPGSRPSRRRRPALSLTPLSRMIDRPLGPSAPRGPPAAFAPC